MQVYEWTLKWDENEKAVTGKYHELSLRVSCTPAPFSNGETLFFSEKKCLGFALSLCFLRLLGKGE